MNLNSNEERKVYKKEVIQDKLRNIILKVFIIALSFDISQLVASIIFYHSWFITLVTAISIIPLFLAINYFAFEPAFTLTIEKSTLTYDSQNETIIFPLPCFIESGKDYITIIYNADCRHTIFCDNEEERNQIMEFLKDAI